MVVLVLLLEAEVCVVGRMRPVDVTNALFGHLPDGLADALFDNPDLHGQVFTSEWLRHRTMVETEAPEGKTGKWYTADQNAPHLRVVVQVEVVLNGESKLQRRTPEW